MTIGTIPISSSPIATGAIIEDVNTLPTGSVTISGTEIVNNTLTMADTLADEDTLGVFTRAWLRDDVIIGGETGTTYDLVTADVGAVIKARISYTDGGGTDESVDSTGTSAIGGNNSPVGVPVIVGTQHEGFVLSVDTSAISDIDGLGAFSYQWKRDTVDIGSATSSTYTLVSADLATNITVVVSYTDGESNSESVESAATHPIGAAPSLPSLGGDYRSCVYTVTQDHTYTVGTSTFSNPRTRLQSMNIPSSLYDGGADSCEMGGGNLAVYTDLACTNRVPVYVKICDTTNSLLDIYFLPPQNSPYVDEKWYVKVLDPGTVQPDYDETYGADAVNNTAVIPDNDDWTATAASNDNVADFLTGVQTSCTDINTGTVLPIFIKHYQNQGIM